MTLGVNPRPRTERRPRQRPLEQMGTCHLCCAWIAPDGTSWHLSDKPGEGSHGALAEALGDPTRGRELDNKGYLHLSYGDAYMGGSHHSPTQAQLDRLFDIAQELTKRRSMNGKYISNWLRQQHEKELS